LSTPAGAFILMGLRDIPDRVLAFVLALASGVMIAVACTELIPHGVRLAGLWPASAGLTAGTLGMGLAHAQIRRMAEGRPSSPSAPLALTGWLMAVALAVHDIPEGLAITAGDSISPHLGFFLAVAIALHNVPEGMSIAAPLLAAGLSRRRVAATTAAVGCVTPLATLLTTGLRNTPTAWLAAILAFAGGVMLTVVAEDALPTAWRRDRRAVAPGLAAGGLLMGLMFLAGVR
jgi:ZIP family zinc transporter